MRYRWAVLAAGTAAAASSAALFVTGLPVLAPVLREEYDLTLGQIGVLLAASWVGSTLTLLPWGLAADRFGERSVLAVGLTCCAACIVGAAYAPSFGALLVLLALAGAVGASVQSASGRAVMHWFGAHERGLALGIRQTAIPLGGLVGALVVPPLAARGGSEAAFLFLGGLCAAGALTGALVLRTREPGEPLDPGSVLRVGRLWRLSLASGLYVFAQVAVLGFAVVFLHDEHGLSHSRAALVLAASQVLGAVLRLAAGRWSDLVRSRVGPLRRVGLAISASFLLTAAFAGGPVGVLVVVLALAGGLSMAWNGLAFVAAAELAGARRSGSAIGFQQTVLSAVGVVAPLVFAAVVSGASWGLAFAAAAAFPLAGWVVLAPLRRQ
jgi:sugar phosphate permease